MKTVFSFKPNNQKEDLKKENFVCKEGFVRYLNFYNSFVFNLKSLIIMLAHRNFYILQG